jgi:hypothetical protein
MPTTPTPIANLTPNGVLRVVLHESLIRAGTAGPAYDLTFEVHRHDAKWDRECIAEARGYNAPLHEFRIRREADDAVWHFEGRVDPDPWVAGGALAASVRLAGAQGRYEGRFAERPIAGRASVLFAEKPRPSRGVARPELVILADWERHGGAGRLYDYSRAGYRHGAEPPLTPELPVFRAAEFGARADSGDEATDGIQAAIAAAERAGGGLVQLDAGVYDVRVDGWRDPLRIAASNVVLRGAGSGPEGTAIVNHRGSDSPEPEKPWLAGQWPILLAAGRGEEPGAPACRVVEAVRGARWLRVESPTVLRVGATYRLNHLENERGDLIRALIGDACTPAANYRGAGVPLISQLLTVQAVEGDRVEVDLPLHGTLAPAWRAELRPVAMLSGVGVERLRLCSHWDGYFVHHKSPEHDNGWDHIGFAWAQDSWVRDVVSENATSAGGLSHCKNCTFTDCRITGNPGHNGYCVGGASTANLLRRLDCERPMHAFNLSGQICGNVLHDCRVSEPAGLDLHGGTCLDTLVDRLVGGVLVGGGADRAVPPRHAPGLTLWNWRQGHYHPYQAWRRVETIATWRQTPGFVAVGVHASDGHRCVYECRDGVRHEDRHSPEAWVESNNQAVHPASLYLLQRAKRMAGGRT